MIQLSLLDMFEGALGCEQPSTLSQSEMLEDVKTNPSIFKNYEPTAQFHELAIEAFKGKRSNIKYVRKDLLTEKFWLESLDFYRDALKEVVKYGEETEEIVLKSVRRDLKTIGLSELQPRSACLEVAKVGDFRSFQLIKNQTEEYCTSYLQSGVDACVGDIDEEFITQSICETAVKLNPYDVQFLPKEFQTEQLELLAVKTLPEVVDFVANQTDNIVWEALKANYKLIKYIREPNEKMISYVLEKDPSYIFDVDNPTEEMYMKAAQGNVMLAQDFPEEAFTERLCKSVVAVNGMLLEHLPKKYVSLEVCMTAYAQNPEAIKFFTL